VSIELDSERDDRRSEYAATGCLLFLLFAAGAIGQLLWDVLPDLVRVLR